MRDLPEEFTQKIDRLMAKTGKFYDRQGNVITWSQRLRLETENPDYHRVALDYIQQERSKVEVSTVWLGSKHCGGLLTPDDPAKPLIFETMVFCSPEPFTHRYATEEEALAGHAHIVKCITEGKPITLEDQDISVKLSVLFNLLDQ